jgi:nitroreductase
VLILAEFEQIILGRRSIRKYRESPISDEIVRHILKMATYAPTASNIQPWIFGVISDSNIIKVLEAFSPGMPRGAGTVIAVCSDQRLAESKGGNRNLCTIDCAMAGENLLLAACEQGIGSCVVCSFNRPSVSALLQLPDYVYLEYLITLGYSMQTAKTPPRKPVASICFMDKWGEVTNEQGTK